MKDKKLTVAFIDENKEIYPLKMATPKEINDAIIELLKLQQGK